MRSFKLMPGGSKIHYLNLVLLLIGAFEQINGRQLVRVRRQEDSDYDGEAEAAAAAALEMEAQEHSLEDPDAPAPEAESEFLEEASVFSGNLQDQSMDENENKFTESEVLERENVEKRKLPPPEASSSEDLDILGDKFTPKFYVAFAENAASDGSTANNENVVSDVKAASYIKGSSSDASNYVIPESVKESHDAATISEIKGNDNNYKAEGSNVPIADSNNAGQFFDTPNVMDPYGPFLKDPSTLSGSNVMPQYDPKSLTVPLDASGSNGGGNEESSFVNLSSILDNVDKLSDASSSSLYSDNSIDIPTEEMKGSEALNSNGNSLIADTKTESSPASLSIPSKEEIKRNTIIPVGLGSQLISAADLSSFDIEDSTSVKRSLNNPSSKSKSLNLDSNELLPSELLSDELYSESKSSKRSLEVDSDPCNEPVSVGNCKGSIPRYFYSKGTKSCEKFSYSGCGQNLNNFGNLQDCQKTCVTRRNSRKTEPNKKKKLEFGSSASGTGIYNRNRIRRKFPLAFCNLGMDVGTICSELKRGNYLDQFFYDSGMSRCLTFVYNGCGGNANRFSSMWECNMMCSNDKNIIQE